MIVDLLTLLNVMPQGLAEIRFNARCEISRQSSSDIAGDTAADECKE